MKLFQLSNEQKQQYRDQGFTIVRGFMAEPELAPLRAQAQHFLDGDHDWPDTHFRILDPMQFPNPRGGFLPIGVQNPSRREEAFRRVAHHPNLHSAMAQLLDGEVELYTDQFLLRHGAVNSGDGGRTFYHQDSYYWRLQPERGCNAWITLNDVGKDAGALGIMPETHKDWTLASHENYFDKPSVHNAHTGKQYARHRIPQENIDWSRDIVLEMQPGDAAFFTNFTWHRAEPNLTGKNQFAYAIAYQLQQE